MAPIAKLSYFAIQGLAEPVRWILSYNNIDFEDNRFLKDETFFNKIKPELPYGKVPVLEIDGKTLHQTSAICRWLAKKSNLLGKNDWDALQADAIVETITDFRVPLANHFYDRNPETKGPKLEPLQKVTVPYYLSRFEQIVKENGGFFVNGQLTWADIYYVAILEYLELMAGGMSFDEGYPNLTALRQKITAFPQIKAWLAKRPPNAY